MAILDQALKSARTYLNDDNGTVWTDAALIPKAQEAHRELQATLWTAGSPSVRAVSAPITIPLGTVALGALTPTDLVTPIFLYEASTILEDWVSMTEVMFFPRPVVQGLTLIYWSWQNEQILFVGATADRRIVVQYRKLITIPSAIGDPIGITFGELYIAPRTAAIAVGSVGNKESYDVMTALANENLAKVILSNRGLQKPERP